jgi:hypothetical protein
MNTHARQCDRIFWTFSDFRAAQRLVILGLGEIGGTMFKNIVVALLALFLVLQFTGGIGQFQRSFPTAICWSLAPSYGDSKQSCSHGGGVMVRLSRDKADTATESPTAQTGPAKVPIVLECVGTKTGGTVVRWFVEIYPAAVFGRGHAKIGPDEYQLTESAVEYRLRLGDTAITINRINGGYVRYFFSTNTVIDRSTGAGQGCSRQQQTQF